MYYKYELSNRIMPSVTHKTVLVWAASPPAVIQQGALVRPRHRMAACRVLRLPISFASLKLLEWYSM